MIYESFSQEDTWKLGYKLGQQAKEGEIYCLCGDLGAGKTVFTKGFAQGLEITDHITSPTFTIVNEYQGRLPLYHFDVYRIASVEEMEDTGYEEYFFGKGVSLVEWAELIKELMPQEALWIQIERDFSQGDDYRRITVSSDKEGECI
ncbi:MAG: tRNA (adenosine(37)-N6)-threonylcarbamoyltransferase complex ATPase subunit type 1 TsaE [Epulopiscium sp.]|jgi:tRNA threonylcarbamoyladenosine biosynthesis protein TsaE|nr:tRNA (adenosine(37)-N6)-threonylcarbamoyltransferase complex ATPase subunit type 1 TsaE [Candidatus Epulonipiscium sp.]